MGEALTEGLSHMRDAGVHQQPLRQRIPDQPTATVLEIAQGQETSLSRSHWLPKRWQVIDHQLLAWQEGRHYCSHPRRDKGVAVRHINEEDLPHRLSWHCSAKSPGLTL